MTTDHIKKEFEKKFVYEILGEFSEHIKDIGDIRETCPTCGDYIDYTDVCDFFEKKLQSEYERGRKDGMLDIIQHDLKRDLEEMKQAKNK